MNEKESSEQKTIPQIEGFTLSQYDEGEKMFCVFHPFAEKPKPILSSIPHKGEIISYDDKKGTGYMVEVINVIHSIEGKTEIIVGKEVKCTCYDEYIRYKLSPRESQKKE
jgi:hypothetical protein